MAYKIAIIGAGIAGLSAATLLKEKGHQVTVFEKARGSGGRMSTRRSDAGRLDHGAQYFTIRDPAFKAFLDRPIFEGAYEEWNARFEPAETESRYVGTPGMNALCKAMAQNLDVKAGVRIAQLKQGNGWICIDEQGQEYGPFDWVISSAPPQQSYDLYKGQASFTDALKDIQMHPCFTMMHIQKEPLDLPADCITFKDHALLGCVSLNHTKPGRGDHTELVIQASHQWSQTHVDDDQERLKSTMIEAVQNEFKVTLNQRLYQAFHRWLYAAPSTNSKQKFYSDEAQKLAAIGDWCLGARVEYAFLSAYALCQDFKI